MAPIPHIEVSRKRSWMMTFSDILLQLLAFFIMRLAIAPYRLGALIPTSTLTQSDIQAAPGKNEAPLEKIHFQRVPGTNILRAELGRSLLPEREEDMSFSLKEELTTLATTFGNGEYIFRFKESACELHDELSTASSFLIGELLAAGVSSQCLQLTSLGSTDELCSRDEHKNPEDSQLLEISVIEQKCDPLAG